MPGHTWAEARGEAEALRRPDLSSLIAGGCPAASDLTERYADVGTWLDGHSIVEAFAFQSPYPGGGNRRYPIGPQMLSVRTEDLLAGAILMVGSP